MELSYNLTKEDFLIMNLHHVLQMKRVKWACWLIQFIGPLLFINGYFIARRLTDQFAWGFIIIFSVLSMCWFIGYPLIFRKAIKTSMGKTIDAGEYDELLGSYVFTVADEGFTEKAGTKSKEVKWASIEKLGETEAYFFLYLDDFSCYIVPKRAFLDSVTCETFKLNLLKKMEK